MLSKSTLLHYAQGSMFRDKSDKNLKPLATKNRTDLNLVQNKTEFGNWKLWKPVRSFSSYLFQRSLDNLYNCRFSFVLLYFVCKSHRRIFFCSSMGKQHTHTTKVVKYVSPSPTKQVGCAGATACVKWTLLLMNTERDTQQVRTAFSLRVYFSNSVFPSQPVC